VIFPIPPRLPSVCLVLVLAALPAAASDWPQFGGPHRNGVLSEASLPDGGMRLETVWRRPLGSGYSGISVVGGMAVTMYSESGSDYLVALNASSGEGRWRVDLGPTYQGHDGSDDGPLSTPTIHDGRVYAVTPAGDLLAVSLKKGKPLWKVSLPARYRAAIPEYGFSTSPVVAGELIVVQVGGTDGNGICAFEASSGELRWRIGDGPAGYRSPMPLTIDGRPQLVVVSTRSIVGLDSATGEILWEHTAEDDRYGEFAAVVPVGGERILVTGWETSRMFEIVSTDEGYALEERWTTSEIKNSYAAPVYRDGLLFGYSNSYLTALDATTGERVWKSRAPGKGVPIRVGRHLAVWARGGTLQLSAADRSGFEPVAQAEVLETASLTAPSFVDGTFYVRNLEEIAAVAVRRGTASATPAPGTVPELTANSELGEFLEMLAAAADKRLIVDQLLEGVPRLPLRESNGVVHFIYEGPGDDVGITGSMIPEGSQSLQRVPGTDLFYRTFRIEPGSRVEYSFVVDFGEPQADPRNPDLAAGSEGQASELLLPGWRVPPYAVEPFEDPRGTLVTFQLESAAMEDTREVNVYLPEDYADTDRDYPLLVVTDINGALDHGRFPEMVDRLFDAGHESAIVAYVPFGTGFSFWVEGYSSRRDDMVRFVADEMLPEIVRRFRVLDGREHTAVVGCGWGAYPALYAALARSDVFGKVAALSILTYDPLNEELATILADRDGEPPLEAYFGWGIYDHSLDFDEHVDLVAMNRQIAEMFRSHEHMVTTREINAGSGWGSWWAHVGPLMAQFFEEPGGAP